MYNRLMNVYSVYYRYKLPNDKAPGIGAVKLFRLYAADIHEARQIVKQQSAYPHIEVIDIKKA